MNFFESMRFGRAIGIINIICGLALLWITKLTIEYYELIYTKILIIGTGLVSTGIGFLLFPGGNIKKADIPTDSNQLKYMWNQAPDHHRVMWIVFFVIGCIAGFLLQARLTRFW